MGQVFKFQSLVSAIFGRIPPRSDVSVALLLVTRFQHAKMIFDVVNALITATLAFIVVLLVIVCRIKKEKPNWLMCLRL